MEFLRGKISKKFLLLIGLAFLLIQIPVFGNYIRLLNTVIHETGHAVIALFGGHIEKIALLKSSEGITYGPKTGLLEGMITSISGYTFSSCMVFFAFLLIRKKKFTLFVDILLAIIFINLIFWVRNLFGIIWLTSFALCFLLLLLKGTENVVHHLLFLIAAILLVDSLKSAYEIFTMSFIQPQMAGDAANLAHLTMFIPAQAWGGFFFFQAIAVTFISFKKGLFKIEG